jgi:hypothetical protein
MTGLDILFLALGAAGVVAVALVALRFAPR